MKKPDIFGILEHSEPFYICIPMHIQNPVIFTKLCTPYVTLKPTHIQNPLKDLRWECFSKIVKSYKHFSKALLDLSKDSEYVHLSVSTH